MTRVKAATIHLLISSLVVGVLLTIVFFVWYPGPTFRITGAVNIVLVLVGVDLVLGPLLTLIVYKKYKPGLKLDLTVIALVQLVALVYGSYTLYQERPYYMVFVVDRLNLVTEKSIDKTELGHAELRQKPFTDVIKVFARLPDQDSAEFQAFLDSVLFDKKPDMEGRPEFWEPYAAGADVISAAVRPLEQLPTKSDKDRQKVRHATDRYQAAHPKLGYLPIVTREDNDIGMLMDMDTLEPLDVIEVDPW